MAIHLQEQIPFLLQEMSPRAGIIFGCPGSGCELCWCPLLCPAFLGVFFVSCGTLVSARAQLRFPGSSQGNPLGWEQPQPSRSCIDPDRSKLPSLSHLQPPFCPSLRKKSNWKSSKMCSFPAGLNTGISVVNLLGSYKIFPLFPELPGQFLGSESSKWICRGSSCLCCKHRHKEQSREETLIEFGCQNPSLGSL